MKRSDEYVFRVALCGAAFLLLLVNGPGTRAQSGSLVAAGNRRTARDTGVADRSKQLTYGGAC